MGLSLDTFMCTLQTEELSEGQGANDFHSVYLLRLRNIQYVLNKDSFMTSTFPLLCALTKRRAGMMDTGLHRSNGHLYKSFGIPTSSYYRWKSLKDYNSKSALLGLRCCSPSAVSCFLCLLAFLSLNHTPASEGNALKGEITPLRSISMGTISC